MIKASLFADRSDKANAQLPLGMWHDDDAASLRMNEHVVRTPDPFQDPAGLLVYPITCIVSQVAASAGFFAPSTSTLTS
jgi:hypothetical protein